MRKFWMFLLNKNLPADSLKNLNYSVFGLGDSNYKLFNAAARKLDVRLS
jgi:sulfite reductase alpha subunit-like flavoprotein